ncbi:MAG TPA: coproporphyrinogen dehydrogenase HemZ, partial [Candidatus Mediterraneibacter stercorigallinarum]|nr:coproporphyrinogen dehydrogenase HemZ [Candidatus Mediterraneibacter stercorigallinarum]
MIEIACKKNKFTYNVYHITKAFFPSEEITQKVDEKQESLVELKLPGGSCFSLAPEEIRGELPGLAGAEAADARSGSGEKAADARSDSGEKAADAVPFAGTEEELAQAEKRAVTRRVYRFLCEASGSKLAWGTLTGVRPTKLAMQMLEEGKSWEEITGFLKSEYFVTEKKAELGYEIACREKELLGKLDCRGGFSLYAGIPFCPSVCSYCSFSSSPISVWKDRVDSYLDALVKEIRAIGRMAQGRYPDTVYIGGGTPTTLEPEQLRRLLTEITVNFDLSHTVEFTVEAGRPDSITEEKLSVLKEFPVTRISINPQTMQQKTLDLVGRKHTVEDIRTAYAMARRLGFDNINMDLIAGLPGEDAADMADTLSQIEAMHPDSLTVHSLAIKRAAKFGQEGRTMDLHSEISQMVDAAAKSAERMGLKPYYLYRQKNIAGNFENVGYAELDKAGIYN